MYKGQWQSHVRSWKGHGLLIYYFFLVDKYRLLYGLSYFFLKKNSSVYPSPPPPLPFIFFIFYFLCIYFRNQILKVKIAWEEEGGPEGYTL